MRFPHLELLANQFVYVCHDTFTYPFQALRQGVANPEIICPGNMLKLSAQTIDLTRSTCKLEVARGHFTYDRINLSPTTNRQLKQGLEVSTKVAERLTRTRKVPPND